MITAFTLVVSAKYEVTVRVNFYRFSELARSLADLNLFVLSRSRHDKLWKLCFLFLSFFSPFDNLY